jgi:hypothetical protein
MLPLLAGGFRALVGQAKRIITAGLRLTGNTTYHHLDHQHNICWIYRTALKHHTLNTSDFWTSTARARA